MSWDRKSFKEMEKRISQFYGKLPDRFTDLSGLVFELPSPSSEDLTKRIKECRFKVDLINAIRETREKFETVTKISCPDVKIEIMNESCAICLFYQGNHSKCIYYDRCRDRFENHNFSSKKEMDDFANEEIEYLDLLENWVWQFIDETCQKDLQNFLLVSDKEIAIKKMIKEIEEKEKEIEKKEKEIALWRNKLKDLEELEELEEKSELIRFTKILYEEKIKKIEEEKEKEEEVNLLKNNKNNKKTA